MNLLLVIAALLVLTASAYAFVGRSARRHHLDLLGSRRTGRSAPMYPNWRPTDRYR